MGTDRGASTPELLDFCGTDFWAGMRRLFLNPLNHFLVCGPESGARFWPDFWAGWGAEFPLVTAHCDRFQQQLSLVSALQKGIATFRSVDLKLGRALGTVGVPPLGSQLAGRKTAPGRGPRNGVETATTKEDKGEPEARQNKTRQRTCMRRAVAVSKLRKVCVKVVRSPPPLHRLSWKLAHPWLHEKKRFERR